MIHPHLLLLTRKSPPAPSQLRFLCEDLSGRTARRHTALLRVQFTRGARSARAHAKYQRENRGQLWISWRATRGRAFFPAKQPLARLCRGFAAKVWRAFLTILGLCAGIEVAQSFFIRDEGRWCVCVTVQRARPNSAVANNTSTNATHVFPARTAAATRHHAPDLSLSLCVHTAAILLSATTGSSASRSSAQPSSLAHSLRTPVCPRREFPRSLHLRIPSSAYCACHQRPTANPSDNATVQRNHQRSDRTADEQNMAADLLCMELSSHPALSSEIPVDQRRLETFLDQEDLFMPTYHRQHDAGRLALAEDENRTRMLEAMHRVC